MKKWKIWEIRIWEIWENTDMMKHEKKHIWKGDMYGNIFRLYGKTTIFFYRWFNVCSTMYRLVSMRSNHYLGLQLNRNVTTNYVHIDLNILYFHQIEYVTILQNTLNQKMFSCHISVNYSNWKQPVIYFHYSFNLDLLNRVYFSFRKTTLRFVSGFYSFIRCQLALDSIS